MIISIVYEIVLVLLGLLYLPKFLYQLIFKGKYRKSLLKRFGSGFPEIKKGERKLLWVHAVSLGETKAVAALVKMLKADLGHPLVLFSTTTDTGYVEACRTISADFHVYLPFDFGWVVRPIIKRTAPDLVVLCESDFWYNFLDASKQAGAMVAVVNGKISSKSLKRFLKVPFFAQKTFECIDLFCVQSSLYRKRFLSLDIPDEKIVVTGNMKFDGDYSRLSQGQLEEWRKELGIKANDPVLVVGSSHHPEETQLLKILQPIWGVVPNLKVMLVPRHPERFNEVAGILQKHSINFRRLSHKNGANENARVILIDAMGLLRKCYQLADVAIVAGSYTQKVGGHNILEPSCYGVPVIFGPYMQNQPDLVDLVREYGAGHQVPLEKLSQVLEQLLQDAASRQSLGEAGLKLFNDVHGAAGKTCSILKKQVFVQEKFKNKT